MARRIDERDLSLDQLRAFVAVVERGSFSAAGRSLGRVQSAMSHSIASLEGSLGLPLFDRAGYRPTLTPAGATLFPLARKALDQVHELAAVTGALGGGAETELSLAVDALFPLDHLVRFAQRFEAHWPGVRLRVQGEVLAAVHDLVEMGACGLGIANADVSSTSLERRPLARLQMWFVAASSHPLARLKRPLVAEELAPFRQVVLSGRGREAIGPDRGVMATETWRVMDLDAKHAFIRAGLGWGSLPEDRARADLDSGALVRLPLTGPGGGGGTVGLDLVWPRGARLGPAARWAIAELEATAREDSSPSEGP